ncbi:MAG: DUF2189 domain-containing protein [Betaproteobacteria bacterium]|nr:MAG: DUF2189 domain-containing protein [Betaproteobacteria bacterium]
MALALGLDPTADLRPTRVGLRDIAASLREGHAMFRATAPLSVACAAIFAATGAILFLVLELLSIAPLSVSLAGGFVLFGPALLAGFFAVADRHAGGHRPTFGDVWRGFRALPRGGWVVSFVCALLLLIWLTDAGTLYGFMVGQAPQGFGELARADATVMNFLAFSSLMGAGLAFILFCVSAFSIPLIHDRRANLVSGVVASVRAVFGRFPVMICWALLLAIVMLLSAWLLPLLLYALPMMAYTSRAFYRRVFPPA